MKTPIVIGQTVWRRYAALVAGVSASIRILIAKAQLRAAGDSNE